MCYNYIQYIICQVPLIYNQFSTAVLLGLRYKVRWIYITRPSSLYNEKICLHFPEEHWFLGRKSA